MKLCATVQEGCGYKDTLRALRYFASLAKYFTVCITYQSPLVLNTSVIFVIFDYCCAAPSILATPANVTLFNKTEEIHAADSLKLTEPRMTPSLLWLPFKNNTPTH